MSTTLLPNQSSDFPAWYGGVVRRAGLAERGARFAVEASLHRPVAR
jgi:hypothetical protein